jgi:hypothetical protein
LIWRSYALETLARVRARARVRVRVRVRVGARARARVRVGVGVRVRPRDLGESLRAACLSSTAFGVMHVLA